MACSSAGTARSGFRSSVHTRPCMTSISSGLSQYTQIGSGLVRVSAKASSPWPSVRSSLNRPERRALTIEECRRLLDALQGHRLEALYVCALTVGLRRGELLGLRWSDI